MNSFFKFKILATVLLFSSFKLLAQQNISGTVVSQAGNTLEGVSISLKGTSLGTSTNNAGKFTIAAGSDATLVFSFIGYVLKEVPVGGRTDLSITLTPSDRELEQVVVVGYGTQRKRDVTGSISTVKGADIARQPVLTPTQAIQGKVAGVQIISSGAPNSAPVVRIRGIGSVLGGKDPLYVVDGILTTDIRNINSADIVSLDILKDASAATIYGVRAANGVILITTKKGRSGKMVVSYDANAGVRDATHLVKMANSTQYATYINEASVNTGNGAILVDPSLTTTNTDWYAAILRKAFWQNHNLSLSGGSDKSNYFFSAGYLTDEGIVINNNFKRLTLRSNNEYKISDKIKITTIGSYSRGTTQDINLGGAYNDAYHAAPIIPSKVNGKYGNTSAYQNVGNPVLDIEQDNNKYIENRIQFTEALDYKPVNWITLHTSYGGELGFNNRRVYGSPYVNNITSFITSGGNQSRPISSLSTTNENNHRWVWDNTATLQKTFDKNDFTLLVGTVAERVSVSSIDASRNGVPTDPNLWYLSQGDPASQKNSSSQDLYTRNSYLGRLSYVYDKKYLLTATFRADGSSLFIKHWSYFPALGLGWNITSEDFMKNQKIFDNLKLRGSYGKQGNDNIPTIAHIQTLSTNNQYATSTGFQQAFLFGDNVDKSVKWETTTQQDIGIEFSVLKNKLSGEVDYYKKTVNDALITVKYLVTAGGPDQTQTTNVASFINKGLEAALTWNNRSKGAINYTLSANASFNQNKIIGLNGGQPIPRGGVGQKGNTTLTTNNQLIGAFYLLQAQGVFHNQTELAAYVTKSGTPIKIDGQLPTLGDMKYADINDDGLINDNDRVFSGSYQPKVTLGFSGSISYKMLDLNFGAYGTLGSKIYNGKKEARFNQKDNVEASVANDRWTFTNYTSNVPRANLNALPHSTYFLESGDFARINNLTLGYTFTTTKLAKYGLTALRCYVSGQNLVTFTKYSGFTPELSNSDPLSQGIELNAYPTTRTLVFGLNVTF